MLNVVSSIHPSILTNMAFWQSPEWMTRVDSIYALDPAKGDPDFMPWWREAWSLFLRRNKYEVILTMGIRESFAFAALCRLAPTRCCHIMTEVFIDTPKHPGLLWQLKNRWYRLLAKNIGGIITNSSFEIETNAARFNVPRSIFRYVPLNTTIAEPEYVPSPDGYLFCAGRTLRDYPTLFSVLSAFNVPWHIVAGAHDLSGYNLPSHVQVHREIDRNAYLKLLQGARIVVLPLLPTERATGQVVLLEAMSYGKPVITTRAPGTIDIIRHGDNGWLVEPGNSGQIIKILCDLLNNPEECARTGHQALHDIKSHYTTETHTKRRIEAIESIWKDQGKPAIV